MVASDESPGPEPLVYSIRETAQVLGVGETTVWRLVRQGELRTVKIGGRTLIRRSEVERYLASLAEQ